MPRRHHGGGVVRVKEDGPRGALFRMFTSGAGLVGRSFSIRVSNIGIGTLRVDDVYIDPYRRG